jgi:hypothetical protein
MIDGISYLAFSPPSEDGRDGGAARRLDDKARSGTFLARLLRRHEPLLELGALEAAGRVRARHYLGLRTVPISSIRGSEGRITDFDAAFRPLNSSTAARWQSVATARYRDLPLPPVELILAGGVYYVRDGHHRVSVAAALGEQYIEANVTTWVLGGPQVLDKPAHNRHVAARPVGDLGEAMPFVGK